MILEPDKYILIPAVIVFWLIVPIALLFGLARCKIIENSSSKLIFILRPIIRLTLASLLAGTGAILLIMLLFYNYFVDFACNKNLEVKTNIQCNLSTKGIVIRHQNQFIPNLRSAKLNIREKKKEDDDLVFEPIIITSQEEINLVGLFGSSDLEKVNKIVDDINKFIKGSERELIITKDDSMLLIPFLWMLSIFIILPLLIVTLSPYRYCSFDSETQEFSLLLKSFFKEKILATSSLQEIEKVEVETWDGEENKVQIVWLYSRSGKRLPLTGIANSYGYHNSLAKLIRKFLKENRQDNNLDE